ncbi:hypothetical protein FIBSPDRAFT_572085 [Athelia psychrophila]|uniref:Uncharacterized protein n=1 Tax=Athelia psychrophila TaxID=1759441 RepID=A0A166HLN3_9AGAM|nr:hypothetical protein FIBSPDRAFT_572085 [Fibularhizoctonia sp. CBS 109695]
MSTRSDDQHQRHADPHDVVRASRLLTHGHQSIIAWRVRCRSNCRAEEVGDVCVHRGLTPDAEPRVTCASYRCLGVLSDIYSLGPSDRPWALGSGR